MRIRRGIFANDLAKVLEVSRNESNVKLLLKVVPRIDLSKERDQR